MSNQRREFLKVSAIAGGAALTTPFIANQAQAVANYGELDIKLPYLRYAKAPKK